MPHAPLKSAARIVAVATLVAGAAASAHADDDVGALLKAADRYRMSSANMQVDTQISVFNTDGSPDKERRYVVFAQAKHQSLVLMQSPAEKGQKVLMLGDDFWLLMPGSQRPLRITPMQKLLGDASTGDIATLSWADDYTGNVAGEEPCGEPVRADLYVQSDKLAKRARFVMDKPAAPTTVTEMLLSDQLTNKKETKVRYLGRKEHTVPEAWLNPMFLARNPSLE